MDIYIARPSPCRRRVVRRRPSSVVVRRRVMRASRRGKISFTRLFRGHFFAGSMVGRMRSVGLQMCMRCVSCAYVSIYMGRTAHRVCIGARGHAVREAMHTWEVVMVDYGWAWGAWVYVCGWSSNRPGHAARAPSRSN